MLRWPNFDGKDISTQFRCNTPLTFSFPPSLSFSLSPTLFPNRHVASAHTHTDRQTDSEALCVLCAEGRRQLASRVVLCCVVCLAHNILKLVLHHLPSFLLVCVIIITKAVSCFA